METPLVQKPVTRHARKRIGFAIVLGFTALVALYMWGAHIESAHAFAF